VRDYKITCDQFNFLDILYVASQKAVNQHARFYIKGHIATDNDSYVIQNSAGQTVTFIASEPEGDKKLFTGLISDINIHNENEMRILTLNVVSKTILMDITPEIRTFQDANMTYQTVTSLMEKKNSGFNIIWPSYGDIPIGSMTVQYKETDWQYAIRLAGRLGTVVIPDYLLDKPYIAIGMTKRPAKQVTDVISYSIKKETQQYRDAQSAESYSERDDIYYIIKSREIFDLCDPIAFYDLPLYVYAIDTKYEGSELVHYYTLKEASGFYTKQLFNENLNGVSLLGRVKEVQQDQVRVIITGDVEQTKHKWFPYATPFSQPDGYGWYFMPEIGDEIRLRFPSEREHDAYVSSAVHITHGTRLDPQIKYIRTIYGQVIQFDPEKILIDDGTGSSITLHQDQGIAVSTNKMININAQQDIDIAASGKIQIAGQSGVVTQKGGSVISIDDAIDISSGHTRSQ